MRSRTPSTPSGDASDRHARKLERIARQLRQHRGGRPVSLRKRVVSHQVPKPKDQRYTDEKIDVGDLDEILELDPESMTCTAESGVTFAEVVEATLRHGLVPIIVPEFKTITVGGAVSGCSIESMSFRHGGFHDTCLEYEVVTAGGEVLRCTPENEHRLVFQMLHGSFGTLGILARLKFRLVRARPFVRVRYERHATLEEYARAIRRHAEDGELDYLDGFLHSPHEHVLNLGTFTDEAPYTSRYDWTKVYYRSTARRTEDFLSTPDYLFRYDRGVTNVHPKSALGRLFFGKALHSDRLLRLAERLHWVLPAKRPRLTVDVFVPLSRMGDFMEWHLAELGHFPLWCVPYRRVRDYEWLSPEFWAGVDDELFVDLAIYGKPQRPGRNDYKALEDELLRVNGVKTLISFNYYDEDTFWRIWNRPNYQAVKAITDPQGLFRDLYAKTCRAPHGL